MRALLFSTVSIATILTAIATELPPINPDNLDPNAAHVCVTVQEEAYTEIQSYTRYYRESTNTWCLAIPPRCTEYRIASNNAYRSVTLYRRRNRYYCCDGYQSALGITYCTPRCDNDCHRNEQQGFCWYPNQCKCQMGYTGPSCNSSCSANTWGPDCTQTCNCGTHGSCDPQTGNCICSVGYTGGDCSQPCVDSFGLHCVHACVCENGGTCNNVNGRCTCPPGFYGAICHKTCDIDGVGEEGCSQSCACQNGGVCEGNTTNCKCQPGYQGAYCAVTCDNLHWGQNCQKVCECYNGVCNHVTGQCTCDIGYDGDSCEIQCEAGYYGNNCSTPCLCDRGNAGGLCYQDNQGSLVCNCTDTGYHGDGCRVRDCDTFEHLDEDDNCQPCTCPVTSQSCHPRTGACICRPGYTGAACNRPCDMPYWGDRCQHTCQCLHGDCNHVTGVCTECYPGYTGDNCDIPCPLGTWGRDCSQACSCRNGADCDKTTGYCNCTAGYHGPECASECPPDRYGPNCTHVCDCNLQRGRCLPLDGQCQCKPGFIGNRCDQECPAGTWGYECRSDCTDICPQPVCNASRGYPCVCDPSSGRSGPLCDIHANINVIGGQQGEQSTKTANISLIVPLVVVSVALLFVIILLVVYFRRRVSHLKRENMEVRFQANGDQTFIPNGHAAGVVNPTYVAENRSNEERYPHLSQRASSTLPAPPRTQNSCTPNRENSCTSDDVNFDHIVAEKLRVSQPQPHSRPTSGNYNDPDEDRYTTLKSVKGEPGATAGSRTSSISDYIDFDNPLSFTTFNQNASSTTSTQNASLTSSNQNASEAGCAYNNSPDHNAYVDPDPTDTCIKRPADPDQVHVTVAPSNKVDNPYDTPKSVGVTQPDTSIVPPVNNGYLTPTNEINNQGQRSTEVKSDYNKNSKLQLPGVSEIESNFPGYSNSCYGITVETDDQIIGQGQTPHDKQYLIDLGKGEGTEFRQAEA